MNTWSPTIRSGCPSQCFNCPCQRKVKANGPSFPSVYLFVFCFCKAYNPSFPVTFLTLQIIRIFLLSWWDLFSNFWCQSWKLSIWEQLGYHDYWRASSKAKATSLVGMRRHIHIADIHTATTLNCFAVSTFQQVFLT